VVWDIVDFCRRSDIYCQGRGSAANSAVCYALGVTKADAVALGLLFERFLSLERDGPPDIDLDIEHSGARRSPDATGSTAATTRPCVRDHQLPRALVRARRGQGARALAQRRRDHPVDRPVARRRVRSPTPGQRGRTPVPEMVLELASGQTSPGTSASTRAGW
jgi:error-prone DNA polymerase